MADNRSPRAELRRRGLEQCARQHRVAYPLAPGPARRGYRRKPVGGWRGHAGHRPKSNSRPVHSWAFFGRVCRSRTGDPVWTQCFRFLFAVDRRVLGRVGRICDRISARAAPGPADSRSSNTRRSRRLLCFLGGNELPDLQGAGIQAGPGSAVLARRKRCGRGVGLLDDPDRCAGRGNRFP